jgi:hypothetical protein
MWLIGTRSAQVKPRWNLALPSFAAATMPRETGRRRSTMPASNFVASVAAETVTPTGARRCAGATLAPSPDMPAVWPARGDALTNLGSSSPSNGFVVFYGKR